jgi:hypothetical protein
MLAAYEKMELKKREKTRNKKKSKIKKARENN